MQTADISLYLQTCYLRAYGELAYQPILKRKINWRITSEIYIFLLNQFRYEKLQNLVNPINVIIIQC